MQKIKNIHSAVTVASESETASELGTFTKNLSSSATASGKSTFLLAVPAISASSDRVLTVTAGSKTYTDSGVFPGKHAANGYVNTICCVKEQITDGVFSITFPSLAGANIMKVQRMSPKMKLLPTIGFQLLIMQQTPSTLLFTMSTLAVPPLLKAPDCLSVWCMM